MVVKRYKLNYQLNNFELVRTLENVSMQKVTTEMMLDMPYSNGCYIYEAGDIIGNSFVAEFVWNSENPNLFD